MDIAVDGEINPTPERIRAVMDKKYVYIMVGESMILSEPDDTHLTVFNPDWQLLELIKTLAAGEGLFVWKPWTMIRGGRILMMDYQQVKERVERESRALPKILVETGIEISIIILALTFLFR